MKNEIQSRDAYVYKYLRETTLQALSDALQYDCKWMGNSWTLTLLLHITHDL